MCFPPPPQPISWCLPSLLLSHVVKRQSCQTIFCFKTYTILQPFQVHSTEELTVQRLPVDAASLIINILCQMAPLLIIDEPLLPPESIVYAKVHFGVGHCISLHKYIITCFCHNNTVPSIFTSPAIMSAFPVLHALAATQYCYRLPCTGCHSVEQENLSIHSVLGFG